MGPSSTPGGHQSQGDVGKDLGLPSHCQFSSQICCSLALWHQGSYLNPLAAVSSSEDMEGMIFPILTSQVNLCRNSGTGLSESQLLEE